jgi:N-acetylneuraminic acid mutarotase
MVAAWIVILSSLLASADTERGDGGDPLHLIFETARAKAQLAVVNFELEHVPAETPAAARTFIERMLTNPPSSALTREKFAADIRESKHLWDQNEFPQTTCARTNVDPEDLQAIFLKLDLCERRLDVGGGPIEAVKLLIHEASHHFEISGSPADEVTATKIAEAIVAAYEKRLGLGVNWQFSPAARGRRIVQRSQHVGIWTGNDADQAIRNRLLVWGGCHGHPDVAPEHGCGYWLNDGGLYDPGTQTWTRLPADNDTPPGRALHTGVWTGNELIVWGGCTSGERRACHVSLQDGGRFNPATSRWQKIAATSDAPVARAEHTAVWTGSEMIVWGGVANYKHLSRPEQSQNTGGRYNPATGRWQATKVDASTPIARRDHSAVWTGTEMIVWGGCDRVITDYACVNYYNTGARYNPATDTWSATDDEYAPEPRRHHTAIWAANIGKMIVFGGELNGRKLRDGAMYDPGTNEWTDINYGGPTPRSNHAAVWTGHSMIVFGGEGLINEFPSTPWQYLPGSDQWREIRTRDTLEGRRDHVLVWTGRDIVTWGGYSERETIQWSGGSLAIQQ